MFASRDHWPIRNEVNYWYHPKQRKAQWDKQLTVKRALKLFCLPFVYHIRSLHYKSAWFQEKGPGLQSFCLHKVGIILYFFLVASVCSPSMPPLNSTSIHQVLQVNTTTSNQGNIWFLFKAIALSWSKYLVSIQRKSWGSEVDIFHVILVPSISRPSTLATGSAAEHKIHQSQVEPTNPGTKILIYTKLNFYENVLPKSTCCPHYFTLPILPSNHITI